MRLIISLLLNGALVYITAWLLNGVFVESFWLAILVGLVLGVINVTIKPIITLLTLPLTILTLGLFLLVINAAMVLLVDWLIPGFGVEGWWNALFFSIILALLNLIVGEVD
jgi:putative membrane protein